jgi:Uma2 family endonuclease
VEEYLAFEEKAKIRHEYMDGEIFAMAGAKRNHTLTASNINYRLRSQLEGKGCEAHLSDLRVRVRETHYVYPDVVVVCGEAKLAQGEADTLLNPLVVFEIPQKPQKNETGATRLPIILQWTHCANMC